jgi:succinate dehydrogenase / fumarate reductase cytochrome b subunit
LTTAVAKEETKQPVGFYRSVIGKKVVMAVTGFLLFGFIVTHLAANLLIFFPREANGVAPINAYAAHLRALPPLLWGARIVLLVAVILHIVAAWQLTVLNKLEARAARRYVKWTPVASTYASRTMVWSGPIIFFYVIYHLLDLTFGKLNPNFEPGHVHHNVVVDFQHPAVAIFYIIANVCLAFHLYHGIWSMCQSVGIAHPRYTPILKKASAVLAVAIGAGFCSIPLAVMIGWVR